MSTDALKQMVDEKIVLKQIAALAAAGKSKKDIVKELGITEYNYNKIIARDDFKQALEDIGNAAVGKAVQLIRTRMSNLGTKAVDVVSGKLDEGDLDAAKTVFKILGLNGMEEKAVADTNIQIVLPGSDYQEPIEVPNGEDV